MANRGLTCTPTRGARHRSPAPRYLPHRPPRHQSHSSAPAQRSRHNDGAPSSGASASRASACVASVKNSVVHAGRGRGTGRHARRAEGLGHRGDHRDDVVGRSGPGAKPGAATPRRSGLACAPPGLASPEPAPHVARHGGYGNQARPAERRPPPCSVAWVSAKTNAPKASAFAATVR